MTLSEKGYVVVESTVVVLDSKTVHLEEDDVIDFYKKSGQYFLQSQSNSELIEIDTSMIERLLDSRVIAERSLVTYYDLS